jgi:16S rRNA (guanine527-N7)-methyltransferase
LESRGLWLRTVCRKNGLTLSDVQVELMEQYVILLLEWNKKINLISRQDEAGVWENHILHSLALLFQSRIRDGTRIMDLGTGGGLPGIPLKILLPTQEFVLVDATSKKITAVQKMIATLHLTGISTVWGRAEELAGNKNLVSQFDYIVARAVAPLEDLIVWSSPFLRDKGLEAGKASDPDETKPPALIALKGGDLDREIADARRCRGVRSIDIENLIFHGSEELPDRGKKVVIVQF